MKTTPRLTGYVVMSTLRAIDGLIVIDCRFIVIKPVTNPGPCCLRQSTLYAYFPLKTIPSANDDRDRMRKPCQESYILVVPV